MSKSFWYIKNLCVCVRKTRASSSAADNIDQSRHEGRNPFCRPAAWSPLRTHAHKSDPSSGSRVRNCDRPMNGPVASVSLRAQSTSSLGPRFAPARLNAFFILYFQKISKGKRNTKNLSAVGQNKIRAITRTTEEKSLPDQRCFVRLSLLISKLPLEGHCDKMLSRRTRDDVDRIDIGALNSVFWSSLSTYYRLSPSSQKDHCAITSAVCS